MSMVKLSQWEAIILEAIRGNGVSNQVLLEQVKKGDFSPFASFAEGWIDFSDLLLFAENNWEDFERAVQEGYQIKFSTINGIKTLLKLKFHQLAVQDYEDKETYLDQVKLEEAEVEWLRVTLSKNWRIVELEPQPQDGRKKIRIEMTHPSKIA